MKAQSLISAEHLQTLNHYQDTLKTLNDSIIDSRDEMVRQGSCYTFIRKLVLALKTPESFYYPFDSVSRISILNSNDQSFRIFNWALRINDSTFRYYGAIQMNNPKKLVLYPLFDYSDYFKNAADSLTTNERWFGALYYKMMEVKNKSGKSYYMLFGWDGNNAESNKKILDVLSFNGKKLPVFGASIFYFGKYDDRNKHKRLFIEYNERVKCSLNYDEELQMITWDHLIPDPPSLKDDPASYVPDGTYEGLKWEEGKWHYVNNVFTSTQKDPPFPDPVDFGKEKKLYDKK
ncbi:MAG: hypothetical protein LH473_06315 [Chitinophagales bacterium]|nr:hypothetical protein [Chitinophagales bacterium]